MWGTNEAGRMLGCSWGRGALYMSTSGKVSQRRGRVSRRKGGEGRHSGGRHDSTGSGECQGHEAGTCSVFWQRAVSER